MGILDYDDFETVLEKIYLTMKFEDKLYDAFSFTGGDCYMGVTGCDAALYLLKKLFNDDDDTILYWIYELECGKNWKAGCFIDKDGNDIKLETAEDLYNYLTSLKE